MLSYKEWKTLNESYNVSLGISTPKSLGAFGASFADLLETKKKKKKMMGDVVPEEEPKVPEDDDEEEPDMDDDEETGDGEMVEPSSKKDVPKPDDDMDDDDEEEGEKTSDPLMAGMKKKMKKKMGSDCCKPMKKKMSEDAFFSQSLRNMFSQGGTKFSDGISVSEDALLPLIDPITGYHIQADPLPGEVGYAPQTRFGVGS